MMTIEPNAPADESAQADGQPESHMSVSLRAEARIAELGAQLAEVQRERNRWRDLFALDSDGAKIQLTQVEVERDRLRAALEAVEWRASGAHFYCPWCGNIKRNGHRPTCARQLALNPREEVRGEGEE